MLTCPRVGASVRIWYNRRAAPRMPLHGRVGIVRISGRGKPRNHGVEVGGTVYVIPCGNLVPIRPPA